MKTKPIRIVLFLLSSVFFTECTNTKNPEGTEKTLIISEGPSSIHNHFERMKYQITGHFSNRFQVMEEESGEPVQEFVVAPILKDRPNEYWVYIELFSPYLIDRPLDQRIEQYVRISRDTFRQEVYYIRNPERFVNGWKEGEFPKINIKEDLIRDEACDLLVIHRDDKPNSFRTVFPEKVTCEMLTSTTEARYVDLVYETDDHGYVMWFTFYNKKKELLKKTKEQGLAFRRLNKNDVGFIDLNKKQR